MNNAALSAQMNIETDLGPIRRNAIRLVFLLTLIGLAPSAWDSLVNPAETLEPVAGVAIAFWAALSALAALGVLFPVRMLPLLLLQWLYKLLWLIWVGLPLWQQGQLDASAQALATANGIGVVLDLLVVPWTYVFRTTFQRPTL